MGLSVTGTQPPSVKALSFVPVGSLPASLHQSLPVCYSHGLEEAWFQQFF